MLRKANAEGRATPLADGRSALDLNVKPFDDLIWVIDAFQSMNAQRSRGVEGPEPLGLMSVLAWCDLHKLPEDDSRVMFVALISAMDAALLRSIAGRQTPSGNARS